MKDFSEEIINTPCNKETNRSSSSFKESIGTTRKKNKVLKIDSSSKANFEDSKRFKKLKKKKTL